MSSILNILLTLVGLKNILRLGNDETRPIWESVLAKTMMMKFNTIAKYARTFRISRMEQNDRQIPNVANARILLNANLVAHNPNLTRFYLLKI